MPEQLQLFDDEPAPGSREAETTTKDFEQHVQRLLETMKDRVKFKILVWGPSLRSKSQVAEKRRDIYRKLKEEKHHCWFSEEFIVPSGYTLKSYELTQAALVDMIILLVEADAPGSLGEMHDFCSHKELLHKILLFFPETLRRGYAAHGLVRDLEKGYRNVEYYLEIDITSCRVLTIVLEWVQARRSYVFSNTPLSVSSGE